MNIQNRIEEVKNRFEVFDGQVVVRREGMGENDYRLVEYRDIENALTLIATIAQEEARKEMIESIKNTNN